MPWQSRKFGQDTAHLSYLSRQVRSVRRNCYELSGSAWSQVRRAHRTTASGRRVCSRSRRPAAWLAMSREARRRSGIARSWRPDEELLHVERPAFRHPRSGSKRYSSIGEEFRSFSCRQEVRQQDPRCRPFASPGSLTETPLPRARADCRGINRRCPVHLSVAAVAEGKNPARKRPMMLHTRMFWLVRDAGTPALTRQRSAQYEQ